MNISISYRTSTAEFVRILSERKVEREDEEDALALLGMTGRRILSRDQEDISRCTPRPRDGTMWIMILEVER